MFSLRLCSKKPFASLTSLSSPSGLINRQNLIRARHLQPIESKCLFRRCYAQLPKKPISKPNLSAVEQAKQQAKVAAANVGSKHYDIAERLLIYHAGTGRITFLAMVKVTTLFLGAFFTFVVVPGYIKAEKPEWETVGVALCGLIPLIFVAYTTSPFVTHIYIHLPPAARTSRPVLERFIHSALPPLDGAYPHDHERHRKASLQHHASGPPASIEPAVWHCKLRARRRGRNGGE
ncbi:uncharacterized protein TrAtP1_006687 [Trichoderma atroviride]|uniref:uncharacterized protein n=1 Tax=Hypocrea atroviridis TaxID=63577 RepID=UPI003332D086|nr:hypothetical protein TrAtP1_006687 [Trichoderma atroviride]